MNNMQLSDIKVLFSEDKIKLRLKELAEEINNFYNGEDLCVISVLKGSVIFATDLVRLLNMPLTMEFVRLSSYGNSTSSDGKIKPLYIDLPDLNDKNVLIVEDIVDTGYTAKYIIDYLGSKYNTKSTKLVSFFNKKIKRQVQIEPDFYAFDIDNRFIVGYGLDYAGLYRNLSFVGYKELY